MNIKELIKQGLYASSPGLYARTYQLYAATYAKHKIGRWHQSIAEKIRARAEYESQIVRTYLANNWTVRHGPFAGMQYAASTTNSLLMPKVIGSYESPIHRWVTDAIAQSYDTILNVGSGEGYYAVGFALRSKESKVYAYDIDEAARRNVAALAQLNRVADRVHIRGRCTIDDLSREIAGRTLLFCDIEGGELDLLRPDLISGLSQADLVVESHDDRYRPVTATLVRRFLATHRIEVAYHCAKSASEFPVLGAIPMKEHAFLLEEGRPRDQCWLRLRANPPGAAEPVQWWLDG